MLPEPCIFQEMMYGEKLVITPSNVKKAPLPYSGVTEQKAAVTSIFGTEGGGMLHPCHPFTAFIALSDPQRRVSDSTICSQQPIFNYFSFGNTLTPSPHPYLVSEDSDTNKLLHQVTIALPVK